MKLLWCNIMNIKMFLYGFIIIKINIIINDLEL